MYVCKYKRDLIAFLGKYTDLKISEENEKTFTKMKEVED